jgi:hypothetical protein
MIIDESGLVSLVTNSDLMLTHAIELNGEIYALASSPTYDSYYGVLPTDVFLLTTVPEPTTLALLGIAGLFLKMKRTQ